MGPEASAKYYNDVLKICQQKYNATQDNEYPIIILYNLPLEDFDENGNFIEETATKQLEVAAQSLEKAGADFVVIVCNTIHALHSSVQKSVSIPVLSLIKEVAKKVVEKNHKKVGLLTSESTKHHQLYVTELAQHQVESIETNEAEQAALNNVILQVMGGKNTDIETEQIKKIIGRMVGDGAESVILGCTEIPLAISQADTDVMVFDSTKILAEAALEYALY